MLKKIIYTIISLFIAYILFGFLALPYILKSQSISYVQKNFNAHLSIDAIQFNPLLFTMDIKNLKLEHEQKELLSLKSFKTDFELLRTLDQGYITISHITFDTIFMHPSIDKQGELNFLKLFASNHTTPKPTDTSNHNTNLILPTFKVDKFTIKESEIIFDDTSRSFDFKMALDKINIILTDIGTFQEALTSFNLQARLNNESLLELKGGLSLNDFKTYGTFSLNKFNTLHIKEFINRDNISLDNMLIDAQIGFFAHYKQPSNEFLLNLNHTVVDMKNFKLHQDSKPILELETLGIKSLELELLKNNQTTQAVVQSALNINDGELKTESNIVLEPLNIDVTYEIKEIPLDILNDITHSFIDINIESLWLNSKGALRFNESEQLQYQGDIALQNAHLTNEQQTLIKFDDIQVNQLTFNQTTNNIAIDTITLNHPYIFVQIDKKSQLNFAKLVQTNKSNTSDEKKQSTQNALGIHIGPIRIKNGTLVFEDLNLPIAFKTTSKNLNGLFSSFASNSTKPSTLKLKGGVGEYGYLQIDGKLVHNNLKYLTQVQLDFDNVALKDLSSYSQKFVGRELEDGKLSLHLYYDLKNSQLEAQNNIIIEQIQLGKEVQSEDAMNLPLSLAIAILEDSNGVIDLHLPISGNVDNPEFSIAPIVWKAFTNLITKAITAPFSLLASLFGIDEEEINSIKFKFAQSDITPIQKEPLDKIANILKQKPKLSIEFAPFYHTKQDSIALQEELFDNFVTTQLKQSSNAKYHQAYIQLLEELYLKHHSSLKSLQETHSVKNELNMHSYEKALKTFAISIQEVSASMLENLAVARLENIKNYLMNRHQINQQQIRTKTEYIQAEVESEFVISNLKVGTIE
jgi:outer membrane protein OmpA-like peptidoglycan-associated protein